MVNESKSKSFHLLIIGYRKMSDLLSVFDRFIQINN